LLFTQVRLSKHPHGFKKRGSNGVIDFSKSHVGFSNDILPITRCLCGMLYVITSETNE
jgi:hypothetical protein